MKAYNIGMENIMKTFLFLGMTFLLASCQMPMVETNISPTPTVQVYVPPIIPGTKEVNILRAPNGYMTHSVARGAIAQVDPLIGSCNVPGSVYMFYSAGALVQYVPIDGTYTQFSLACKNDVERHNSQSFTDQWDIVTVSLPGPVFDLSHDTPCPVLTIRFVNNDGSLHLFNGQAYDNMFSLADYDSYVNADGSPKTIIKSDFDAWGATDGHSVIHMQLGGDGVSIPSATFHY